MRKKPSPAGKVDAKQTDEVFLKINKLKEHTHPPLTWIALPKT